MIQRLTVDSSVFVSALRERKLSHKICKRLIDLIAEGKYEVILPYTILVEVVSVVKRRTGSKEFAHFVEKSLLEIADIIFVEVVRYRALASSKIVQRIGVRGMDAIVIQVAQEYKTTSVTLDTEMSKKAKFIVPIKSVEKLIN